MLCRLNPRALHEGVGIGCTWLCMCGRLCSFGPDHALDLVVSSGGENVKNFPNAAAAEREEALRHDAHSGTKDEEPIG